MFIFNAKLLRQERIKQGFTYGEFAKALRQYVPKAAKSIICNWENGAMPSANYLMAISKILGKSPDDFMKIGNREEIKKIQTRLKTKKKMEAERKKKRS